MTDHHFFFIGLSLMSVHELDAVRCKEWRIIPGLSLLHEKTGGIVFLFAHIPLFYFVFWQMTQTQDSDMFIKGFDIFMIVHFVLHIVFLKHKNNEFKDWVSWTILSAAGLCGLTDLLIQ